MLPGWSPQLGQLPHRENRELEYKRVQQKYGIRSDQSMPNLSLNKIHSDAVVNDRYGAEQGGAANVPSTENFNTNNPYNLKGDYGTSQPNNIYFNNGGVAVPPPNQLSSQSYGGGYPSGQPNLPNNANTVRGSQRDRGFLSKAAENSLNSYNNFQSPQPQIPTSTRNNNKYGTGLGHNIFGINYNNSTLIPNN